MMWKYYIDKKIIITAIGIGLVFLTIEAAVLDREFLAFLKETQAFSLLEKIRLSLLIFKAWWTLQSAVDAWLSVVTAILVGLNISFIILLVRSRARIASAAGTSVLGTSLGILGVGCASCGSVILAAFFGIASSASWLIRLPFRGLEFNLLGIVLLAYALVMAGRKLSKPLAC